VGLQIVDQTFIACQRKGKRCPKHHLKILASLYHGRHLLRDYDSQGWMLAHRGPQRWTSPPPPKGKR
jgi:hypothetical protein